MAEKNSYVPEVKWAEYLDSIRHRYPYEMPPAIEKKEHPRVFLEGKYYRIAGGVHGTHKRPSMRLGDVLRRRVGKP
jgi:hypothetical protein